MNKYFLTTIMIHFLKLYSVRTDILSLSQQSVFIKENSSTIIFRQNDISIFISCRTNSALCVTSNWEIFHNNEERLTSYYFCSKYSISEKIPTSIWYFFVTGTKAHSSNYHSSKNSTVTTNGIEKYIDIK